VSHVRVFAMALPVTPGQADPMARFTKGCSGRMGGTTVGIVGGTGPAGSGLAVRLAAAGHTVLLGSRDEARATARADELRGQWGERLSSLRGVANLAATDAEVVVLATVADSLVATAADLADHLAGRVVV